MRIGLDVGGTKIAGVALSADGKVLFETSLTTGATVAGAFTILAPMLTAVAALAALLSEVRVKVVYIGDPPLD